MTGLVVTLGHDLDAEAFAPYGRFVIAACMSLEARLFFQ